jgi:hypothetical protein
MEKRGASEEREEGSRSEREIFREKEMFRCSALLPSKIRERLVMCF